MSRIAKGRLSQARRSIKRSRQIAKSGGLSLHLGRGLVVEDRGFASFNVLWLEQVRRNESSVLRNRIDIDHLDGRAIRREIGERLTPKDYLELAERCRSAQLDTRNRTSRYLLETLERSYRLLAQSTRLLSRSRKVQKALPKLHR
jgi:hypothetical protein